jgi:hypothetical protein
MNKSFHYKYKELFNTNERIMLFLFQALGLIFTAEMQRCEDYFCRCNTFFSREGREEKKREDREG